MDINKINKLLKLNINDNNRGEIMNENILRTFKVTKRFGGIIALQDVSINVPKESIVMLIGPNGSGKTTLINVISGQYKPDSGKIYVYDKDITGLSPHKIYKIGISRTFQIPLPFRKLTVLENLLVVARNVEGEKITSSLFKRKKWIKDEEELAEKAMEILEIINLDHLWDNEAGNLSGGQMKLLEIGRALMSDPEIILMDEPVAGVNPKLANEIMEHVLALRDEYSISFLIVEHRLDIVLKYVDIVYAMHNGRVIAVDSPDKIISHPAVAAAYLGG